VLLLILASEPSPSFTLTALSSTSLFDELTHMNHCGFSHQNLFFLIILFLSSSRSFARAFVSPTTSTPSRLLPSFGILTTRMSTSSSIQCTTSFSDFLATPAPIQPHVVFGNEAGDADSIISALSLAFVDSVCYKAPKTPIVSIPRADLCLRRETVLLLELANVEVDKLHFMDDPIVLDSVKDITLVDHNRLTIEKDSMEDVQVVEILDHHYDEGCHTQVQGDLRNVAFQNDKALVASTCTLVAERLFASDTAKPPYDSHLSIALLGVILLDTVNMKPEAGKGTARDQAAIGTLVHKTDWSTLENKSGLINTDDGTIDTDNLFDLLSESKYDQEFWRGLSVADALRLDYKRFQSPSGHVFGASSILLEIDAFLSKTDMMEELQSYMEQVGVPLLAVLSSQFKDNAPRREMLLCGSNEKLVNDMTGDLLTSSEASIMKTEEVPLGMENGTGALTLKRFRQGNPKASRKQVAPILLNFYKSATSSSL